jgi:TldD protein
MLDLLSSAVHTLRRRGADHVEVRHITDEAQQLAVRGAALEGSATHVSAGFGVRVLAGGAWGFGARAGTDEAALVQAGEAALAVARAAATIHGRRGIAKVTIAPAGPARGRYATPVVRDFFAVGVDEKVALLLAATAALEQGARGHAVSATAHLAGRKEVKHLATSDGTAVTQEIAYAGCGMKLVVKDGDVVQHRNYPLELDGGVMAGGYEVIERFDLVGSAPRIAEQCLELVAAPECPSGKTTVILGTEQLALQIHESCGHPTEGDRALGEELSLAGGSFLTPDLRGTFRYGSDLVTLSADARIAGALGTFGWDDEGVPARKTMLVERGRFVGYLTSREVAARMGLPESGGCVRAEAWNRFPIVRMTNVSLEPVAGGPSLEELIADTDDGILFGNNKSWSIDDLRLNFQFGCEIAWEVKRGKRTRVLRNPMYRGSTPNFWAGCDAVGGPQAFQMWGLTSCGKGDPMQLMAVGHGCPPARFRGVDVGSGE